MALLETPKKAQDFNVLDFNLLGTDGKKYDFGSIKGENGTVIMFICNHCPYVKAIITRLVEDCKLLQEQDIGCVAIMPNNTVTHPADSYENMVKFAQENSFSFPYLIDETQEVAKAYGAVCTPDLYGFNRDQVLQYRGRLDSAGPNEADESTKRELKEAMFMIAQTGIGPDEQFPSMGCSIKWKA